MLQPLIQLRDYHYARWCCLIDGWFETGSAQRIDAVTCPKCGMDAMIDISCGLAARCSGRTTRTLPFVTRPRLHGGMNHTATFQINENGVLGRGFDARQYSLRGGKRSSRQGSGKKGAPKQWPPTTVGEA